MVRNLKTLKFSYTLNNFLATTRSFRLKRNAIPTLNLPIVSHGATTSKKNENLRRERAARRNKIKEELVAPLIDTVCPLESDATLRMEEDLKPAEEVIALLNSESQVDTNIQFRDFEVQVNSPFVPNISSMITTDQALNSLTGLSNFQMLHTIERAVKSIYKDERVNKLTIKDRIILTFTKLKCNLSYYVLSVLFGITVQLCTTYISKMISILSSALKCTIRFVDMNEIQKNMPSCFMDFTNVRVVVDCTEVTIQKPKCLCCRIKFYSQYKSNTTVKIMIGVSPAGLITFISRCYGGRASDKAIFEQSDIITQMNRGDAVMVDKGFLIDELCDSFGIKLIRPPFLKNKKQLSAKEADLNSKIARARVHVERVNQRIKIFKILTGPLPFSLVPKIDCIFTIICAVTNLSPPILSDSRF